MIQCLGINMSLDDINNPFEKENRKKKLERQERKRREAVTKIGEARQELTVSKGRAGFLNTNQLLALLSEKLNNINTNIPSYKQATLENFNKLPENIEDARSLGYGTFSQNLTFNVNFSAEQDIAHELLKYIARNTSEADFPKELKEQFRAAKYITEGNDRKKVKKLFPETKGIINVSELLEASPINEKLLKNLNEVHFFNNLVSTFMIDIADTLDQYDGLEWSDPVFLEKAMPQTAVDKIQQADEMGEYTYVERPSGDPDLAATVEKYRDKSKITDKFLKGKNVGGINATIVTALGTIRDAILANSNVILKDQEFMLDFIDEAMIFAGTAPSDFSVADMIAHQQQMVSEKFYHAIVDSDPALAKIINFDTKNVLLSQISQRHGYITEQPILTAKGKPNQKYYGLGYIQYASRNPSAYTQTKSLIEVLRETLVERNREYDQLINSKDWKNYLEKKQRFIDEGIEPSYNKYTQSLITREDALRYDIEDIKRDMDARIQNRADALYDPNAREYRKNDSLFRFSVHPNLNYDVDWQDINALKYDVENPIMIEGYTPIRKSEYYLGDTSGVKQPVDYATTPNSVLYQVKLQGRDTTKILNRFAFQGNALRVTDDPYIAMANPDNIGISARSPGGMNLTGNITPFSPVGSDSVRKTFRPMVANQIDKPELIGNDPFGLQNFYEGIDTTVGENQTEFAKETQIEDKRDLQITEQEIETKEPVTIDQKPNKILSKAERRALKKKQELAERGFNIGGTLNKTLKSLGIVVPTAVTIGSVFAKPVKAADRVLTGFKLSAKKLVDPTIDVTIESFLYDPAQAEVLIRPVETQESGMKARAKEGSVFPDVVLPSGATVRSTQDSDQFISDMDRLSPKDAAAYSQLDIADFTGDPEGATRSRLAASIQQGLYPTRKQQTDTTRGLVYDAMTQDYGKVLEERPQGYSVEQEQNLRSDLQPEGIADMFYDEGTAFGDQNIQERENRDRLADYKSELEKLNLSTNPKEKNDAVNARLQTR